MNIELNKQFYQVNSNEFNTIIHNDYNNLRIREKLGFYERIETTNGLPNYHGTHRLRN